MKKFDIRVRLFAVLFALVFAFGIAACGGEERENETPAELSAEEVNSFSARPYNADSIKSLGFSVNFIIHYPSYVLHIPHPHI